MKNPIAKLVTAFVLCILVQPVFAERFSKTIQLEGTWGKYPEMTVTGELLPTDTGVALYDMDIFFAFDGFP